MGTYGCGDSRVGTIYVLTTNRTTGALTLENYWTQRSMTTGGSGYSADFSPSEKYVYTTQLYPPQLQRYDISSKVNATIQASEWKVAKTGVANNSNAQGGQVRRGPDDRMYIANLGQNYISYIDSPDQAGTSIGAIGFKYNGLQLGQYAESGFGLPQMATVFQPVTLSY